jgi:hypothetical protein
MNWLLEGKEVTSRENLPVEAIGFVYKITNNKTGKMYIGKKVLESKTKKALTKKEQSEWDKPGRVPKKKLVVKESNWADYWGSCKPLLEEIKSEGKENYTREIIKICQNKRQLSYFEVYYQFEYKVLHIDSFNENIGGKYFRRDAV